MGFVCWHFACMFQNIFIPIYLFVNILSICVRVFVCVYECVCVIEYVGNLSNIPTIVILL